MKRIYAKLLFLTLFIALISSAMTPVYASVEVGVADGDTFTFVVESYSTSEDDDEGYYLGYDEGTDYYAQQGDEFTITFVNATPYDPYGEGEYRIDYEISIGSDTFTDDSDLDSIGGFVTGIDWDHQITELQGEIDEFNTEIKGNENLTGSFSIIDTSTEVGAKGSATETEGGSTFTRVVDIRMERSTGVLLYEFLDFKGSFTDEGVSVDFDEKSVVKRKGYSLGGDDGGVLGDLPGFEITTIIAAFSLMFIPIILRRRK